MKLEVPTIGPHTLISNNYNKKENALFCLQLMLYGDYFHVSQHMYVQKSCHCQLCSTTIGSIDSRWVNIRVWIQNTLRLQLSLFTQVIVQKCEVGQAHEWSHPISKCK
jgi:hypothetical protein